MDWNTVIVIIATGVVTGGISIFSFWLQNKWSRKRDIDDAKRKYRENIIRPIREAIDSEQKTVAWRDFINKIKEAEEQLQYINPESTRLREILEERHEHKEARNMIKTLTEFIPLITAITNNKTKQAIEQAMVYAFTTSGATNQPTQEKVEEKFRLAYKALEDFVTQLD